MTERLDGQNGDWSTPTSRMLLQKGDKVRVLVERIDNHMGARFEFRCPSCGYEATVSGGEDVGMSFYTTTIVCHTCKELDDVETGRTSPATPEARKSITPECYTDPSHPVWEWQHPGPCPRCGAIMNRTDEAVLLWD